MAETENRRFNKNHTIDLKQIRLDVYRLVCYFEAARNIEETHASQEDYAIDALPREFFTDEVSRILLQTAIILRMLDDESEAEIEERNPFFSGTLEQAGQTKQLSLRDACNKIIHSHKINFDQEHFSVEGAEGEYFTPTVYLYGRQNGHEWKAVLQYFS